jgi:hypothetical protein
VKDVKPVPPDVVGKAVPDKLIANVPLDVMGEPAIDKNDGTVAATLVTVPPVPVALIVIEPEAFVMVTPVPAVNVAAVYVVPLPIGICPFVGVDVMPVPPLATGVIFAANKVTTPALFFEYNFMSAVLSANSPLARLAARGTAEAVVL